MWFECHYCPTVFFDFGEMVRHFEQKHRQEEHIVLELPEWLTEGKENTDAKHSEKHTAKSEAN